MYMQISGGTYMRVIIIFWQAFNDLPQYQYLDVQFTPLFVSFWNKYT